MKQEEGLEKEVEVIGVKGPIFRGRSIQKTLSYTTPKRRNNSGNEWDMAWNSRMKRDMISLFNRVKFLESDVDENAQRLRKATVIASSSELRGLESELVKIKNRQGANSEVSDLEQILLLIKRKYGIVVDELEIFANHWLPNGSYILKFVYRNSDNSVWQRLIEAMRIGGDKTFNFYLNIFVIFKQ